MVPYLKLKYWGTHVMLSQSSCLSFALLRAVRVFSRLASFCETFSARCLRALDVEYDAPVLARLRASAAARSSRSLRFLA
jgi:hypothetical protein